MKPFSLAVSRCALLLAAVALAGCTTDKENAKPVREHQQLTMEEAAAQMGNPLLANKGDLNAQNYNVSTSEELEKIENGADGEITFTDPDNPDKEIAAISEAFENRRNGNGWLTDYSRALRFAHRECRPLLIWFHDSVVSPKSGRLGEMLLDTPKFDDWCRDRVVRVKLDSGASIDDRTRDTAKYSYADINRLAARYGLRKKPSIAVIAPTGRFIVGMDGYNGFVEEVDSIIKKGVQDCETEMQAYFKKLEGKGYRTWHSANGQLSLFAKLHRYDEAHRMVYLKEYGGRITRTKLSRFSEEDADYLREELEKTGKTL